MKHGQKKQECRVRILVEVSERLFKVLGCEIRQDKAPVIGTASLETADIGSDRCRVTHDLRYLDLTRCPQLGW